MSRKFLHCTIFVISIDFSIPYPKNIDFIYNMFYHTLKINQFSQIKALNFCNVASFYDAMNNGKMEYP